MKSADRSTAASSPGAYSEIFLFLAAVVLFFVFLGSTEFYGSEQRWAEVTREMLLSGDFFCLIDGITLRLININNIDLKL